MPSSNAGPLKTRATVASPIRVAVSYGAIAAPIEDVGRDLIQVVELLPPNVEPHEYSLAPALVSEASQADILVISGHLSWELDLAQQVALSKGLPEKNVTIDLVHDFPDKIRWLTLPNETGVNLHGFWYLPENYLTIAGAVRDRLAALRPDLAQSLEQNYQDIVARMSDLDARISAIADDLKQYNREVLITYPEEQYLIAPFSLEVGESLVGSSEEITLSAARMQSIVTNLGAKRYSLIITSDLSQLMTIFESAREISSESGVPIVVLTAFPTPSFDSLLMYNGGALETGFMQTTNFTPSSSSSLDLPLLAIIALLLGIAALEYYFLTRKGH
ncbi:MAG TPA: zinc ABC transporter substrate-binding protein [Thermoproteota archaeon]|nr:zinc ABC transporter substrate-binding protein [Thermoproteota archaeon]